MIVVVSSKYPPEYSGSGYRAHQTYTRLKSKYGAKFEVLTSSITFNYSEKYLWDGAPVMRISKKPFSPPPPNSGAPSKKPSLLPRLWRRVGMWVNFWFEAIPTFKYLRCHYQQLSVFHIFGDSAVTATALVFAWWYRKPVVIELCNEMALPRQYLPFPLSLVGDRPFRRAACVVCISPRIAENCKAESFRDHLWSRPNPVDEKRFRVRFEDRSALRHHSRFASNDILLVNVSVFIPRKNQIFLVEALAHLPSSYKLVLAGPLVEEGPTAQSDKAYFQFIQARIKALNLEDRIEIKTGYTKNMEELIQMADVYLFPSLAEGLGTPMLESIACGVPVVATQIPGVTDTWIKNGVNGFNSDREPKRFAECIEKALQIPQGVLRQASHDLLAQASTDVVDRQYWEKIQPLLGESC